MRDLRTQCHRGFAVHPGRGVPSRPATTQPHTSTRSMHRTTLLTVLLRLTITTVSTLMLSVAQLMRWRRESTVSATAKRDRSAVHSRPIATRAVGVVLVVMAVLALSGSAPSSADAYGWRMQRSLAIADHVWRPSCDVRVRWGDKNPDSPEDVAWALVDECVVELRGDFVLTRPGDDSSDRTDWFTVLCTIVLHEVGHLAGADHSDNALSIMFPLMWRMDPRCRDRGRPYLAAAGLL